MKWLKSGSMKISNDLKIITALQRWFFCMLTVERGIIIIIIVLYK